MSDQPDDKNKKPAVKERDPDESVSQTKHKTPHYKKNADGTAEVAGPMTANAFRESSIYKGLSEDTKKEIDKQIDAALKADKDAYNKFRIVVQNRIETKDGKETTTAERIHMGELSYDVGGNASVNITSSFNIANQKTSNVETIGDNQKELVLKLKEDRLPNVKTVTDFITDVEKRVKSNELSQAEPSKDTKDLARALAAGHSGTHEYEHKPLSMISPEILAAAKKGGKGAA